MPRMSTSSPSEISTVGCTITLGSRLSVAWERSGVCLCPSCGLRRTTPLCISQDGARRVALADTLTESGKYLIRLPVFHQQYAPLSVCGSMHRSSGSTGMSFIVIHGEEVERWRGGGGAAHGKRVEETQQSVWWLFACDCPSIAS